MASATTSDTILLNCSVDAASASATSALAPSLSSASPSPRKRTKRSPVISVSLPNSLAAYCNSTDTNRPSPHCSHKLGTSINYSNSHKPVTECSGNKLLDCCNDVKSSAGYCGGKSDTYCIEKSSAASPSLSKFQQPRRLIVVSRTNSPIDGVDNDGSRVRCGASSSSDSISLSGSCSESDSRKESPVLQSPPLLAHAHHAAALSSLMTASSTPGVNLFAAVAAAAASAAAAVPPTAGITDSTTSSAALLSPSNQRQAALALSLSMGLSGGLGPNSSLCSSTLDTPPVIAAGSTASEPRSSLIVGRNGAGETPLDVAAGSSSTPVSSTRPLDGTAHTSPSTLQPRSATSLSPSMTSVQVPLPGPVTSLPANAAAPLSLLASVSWPPLQDFDGLDAVGFDGSLSGLSDLAGTTGYMGDMLELVKRQSSHSAPATSSFVLMAPTSSAVRLHEEPLTYLNQGQSYEIKCKKLNILDSSLPPRLYTSVLRVGFNDRRQKFQEKELLTHWKQLHNCNKIIDADIPMSFNVFNVKNDLSSSHIEFTWDCSKSASIFIRINCISTEFTAHKHGGEKGVPFRLQVDTYPYSDINQTMSNESNNRQLHSAYAQIKVFKTKGADRKIKTDRERAEKRLDKEKYQPSYDYTVMIETFPSVDPLAESDLVTSPPCRSVKLERHLNSCSSVNTNSCVKVSNFGPPPITTSLNNICVGSLRNGRDSVISSQGGTNSPSPSTDEHYPTDTLLTEASPNETSDCLRRQRFGHHAKLFASFSGVDLLRMNRDDLIKLCGMADGIRPLQPKLNLYMCVPGAPAYHAVFLKALTLAELVHKVCDLIQVQPGQIYDVYCQGPDGINVHVNDEVVQNLPDKSRFTIEAMKCGEISKFL